MCEVIIVDNYEEPIPEPIKESVVIFIPIRLKHEAVEPLIREYLLTYKKNVEELLVDMYLDALNTNATHDYLIESVLSNLEQPLEYISIDDTVMKKLLIILRYLQTIKEKIRVIYDVRVEIDNGIEVKAYYER